VRWFAGCVLAVLSVQAVAADKVVLQLRWVHQFQFAGYYAALEKGYYAREGLDVEIRPAGPARPTPLDEVLAGHAQYGVGNAGLVVAFESGKPVVALAAIFQRSPNIWLTLESSDVHSIQDLARKRLMMTVTPENAELLAMFASEGIRVPKLKLVPSTFDLKDLIEGRADAFNAYATNEPFLLAERGVPYRIFDPHDYGIDFYSDVLFTSRDELESHPQRAAAFRRASLAGWQYALDHPEEIVDLIISKYGSQKRREHLLFEARGVREIMAPDLIAIGHMNPARWVRIQQTFQRLGMTPGERPLDAFLFQPGHADRESLMRVAQALGVASVLGLLALVFVSRFNTRLKREVADKEAAQTALEHSLYFFKESQRAARIGSYRFDFDQDRWTASEVLDDIFGIGSGHDRSLAGWMSLVHPDDQAMMSRYVEDGVMGQGQPFDKSYRVIRPCDGQIRWLHGQGRIEQDAAGRPVTLLGTIRDVTDERNAALALLESETRFHSLYNTMAEGVALHRLLRDAEGRPVDYLILEANPAFETHTGLAVDAVTGKRASKVYGAALFLDACAEVATTGGAVRFETYVEPFDKFFAVSVVSPAQDEFATIFADISEHVRMEEELRQTSARFEAIIEASPIPMGVYNDRSEVTYLNSAFSQTFGYGIEDVPDLDRWWACACPEPAHRRAMQAAWHAHVVGARERLERFEPIEMQITIRSGQVRTVLAAAAALPTDVGSLQLVTLVDITERRENERRLAESERQYRQFFDSNTSIKWLVDPADGRIVEANEAAAEFYGYTKDQLRGMAVSDINCEAPDEISRDMADAESAQCRYFLFRHRVASGELRDVEVYSGPMEFQGRTLLFSIIHDITDRTRAQQEVQRLLRERNAILEHAGVGISFVVDRRQIWANQRLCEMVGYPPEQMQGQSTRFLYSSEADFEAFGAEAYPALARNETYSRDMLLQRQDGSHFWAQISGVALDAEKPGEGSIWTFEDITASRQAKEDLIRHRDLLEEQVQVRTAELRTAKEAAEAANRSKSAFLANMSH